MLVKSRKATHGQLRRFNRQLLLRAVYSGLANSRADLAHETGLAKPTVSDLISELIDEGYLIETGLGQSTDEGGKRPRLLRFVPEARHMIGVSMTSQRALGVLTDLNGRVLVEHYADLPGTDDSAVYEVLCQVINGLIAQLDSPLLAIGVGVPGLVDSEMGIVHYAAHLDWHDYALTARLRESYEVPAYVANSTALAALGQFAFAQTHNAENLVTLMVDDTVGIGTVLDGNVFHGGGDIGNLLLANIDGKPDALENHLGWGHIRPKLEATLGHLYPEEAITYLHLRQAVTDGRGDAIALQQTLADALAPVFAWIIALLRPDHISLVGSIADLGDPLLRAARSSTARLISPTLMNSVTFSVENTPHLVAVGAVAHTLGQELGLL
jgi:predicted NBD/HSP70 family sugar kinase